MEFLKIDINMGFIKEAVTEIKSVVKDVSNRIHDQELKIQENKKKIENIGNSLILQIPNPFEPSEILESR